MPDRASYALTPSQRDHLQMLLVAGALGRDTCRCAFDTGMRRVNPNVIGILIDKGFAEKRTKTHAQGRRCAHYWLTEGGAVLARQILKEET